MCVAAMVTNNWTTLRQEAHTVSLAPPARRADTDGPSLQRARQKSSRSARCGLPGGLWVLHNTVLCAHGPTGRAGRCPTAQRWRPARRCRSGVRVDRHRRPLGRRYQVRALLPEATAARRHLMAPAAAQPTFTALTLAAE